MQGQGLCHVANSFVLAISEAGWFHTKIFLLSLSYLSSVLAVSLARG